MGALANRGICLISQHLQRRGKEKLLYAQCYSCDTMEAVTQQNAVKGRSGNEPVISHFFIENKIIKIIKKVFQTKSMSFARSLESSV